MTADVVTGEGRRRLSPLSSTAMCLVIAAGGALLVAAASGVLTPIAFSQVSWVKWALIVVGVSAVLSLAIAPQRLTAMSALCIVAMPFSSFTVTVGGLGVSPIWAVLLPTCAVAFLTSDRTASAALTDTRSRTLTRVAAVAAMLLLPVIMLGSEAGSFVGQVLAVGLLAYAMTRACALHTQALEVFALIFVLSAAAQALIALQELRSGRMFNAYGGGSPTYGPSYFFGYDGAIRPAGTFSDPISLANMLAIALPFAFVGAANAPNVWLQSLYLLSALAIASSLTLTLSRMSWVGGAVGVLVALLLSPVRSRLRQFVAIIGAGAVLFVVVFGLAGSRLSLRFSSLFDPTGQGVSTADGDRTREQLWDAALRTFSEHPIFGVGFGNLVKSLPAQVFGASNQSHAHSTYFQFLAEGGLLAGTALLMLILGAGVTLSRRIVLRAHADWVPVAAGGSLVCLLIVWTTDYTIRYTPVLLVMALPFIFGICGGAIPVAALSDAATPRRGVLR